MGSYYNAIIPLLPPDLRNTLNSEANYAVEAALRLVADVEPIPNFPDAVQWAIMRTRASELVGQLKRGEHSHASSSQKRRRDEEEEEATSSPKKARTDDPDDAPIFTLHALSVTSPVRKKVDITVHAKSIRLTHPTSHELEHPPIPTSAIGRVFLVPTRGKSKPHWTVLIIPSDIPAAALPKGSTEVAPAPQITFGLDATLTAALSTTAYNDGTAASPTAHPKGSPSLPALRTFLSHLPVPVLEPSTTAFKSAANGDIAGVEAYRGAKPGTLWFLDAGVLWDGKPCEFFAVEHLTSGEPYEGVRTLSATGRTCSVIVRRLGGMDTKGKGKGKAKAEEDDDEEGEEEDGVDTDFGMVDGKEREPIGRWIKARRHRFGQQKAAPAKAAPPDGAVPRTGAPKEDAVVDEDESDEDDENFTVDSSELEADSSSDSDDSDASDGGGSGSGEDDASDAATNDGAEEEDGEEAKLKPENHPLLRPGAMPKMSRAALDMVVNMVEQDMMGGRKADSDDGEDELDD